MTERQHEKPEDVLDRALDLLVRGEDWRAAVPDDHPERDEILQLLEIAGQVAGQFARGEEADDPDAQGIWRRILGRAEENEGREEADDPPNSSD
ncbi:MAG: hypothetical protein V3V06_02780 [Dehalococcoidia bacterium]